jgi:hypothetical protein
MGKLGNMIGVMAGISALFYFTGLLQGTLTSGLLTLILNPQNLQTSELIALIGAGGLTILGLAASLFTSGTQSDLFIFAGLATYFASFTADFIVIFNQIGQYGVVAQAAGTLIISPILITYVIAVVDWWRGTDT